MEDQSNLSRESSRDTDETIYTAVVLYNTGVENPTNSVIEEYKNRLEATSYFADANGARYRHDHTTDELVFETTLTVSETTKNDAKAQASKLARADLEARGFLDEPTPGGFDLEIARVRPAETDTPDFEAMATPRGVRVAREVNGTDLQVSLTEESVTLSVDDDTVDDRDLSYDQLLDAVMSGQDIRASWDGGL